MYHNNRYIVCNDNTISSKFLSHDVKIYHQFCTMHGLKQLIQSLTGVTSSNSTLIDHISTSVPSTISKIKTGAHKYWNFLSLKSYTADYYKEALQQIDFPNYENFDDLNETYSNFFQKLMTVFDKIAPYKSKRAKDCSEMVWWRSGGKIKPEK